jgi:hypothetical protein
LNVWDFGGQEIFYATHQFFLSDDAVYILAWTKEANVISHRERDKEILPHTHQAEKWQTVAYWLDTIRRHAPKSPVLVVQTHTDCGKEKINETDFEEFEVSEFFDFSALDNDGLIGIRRTLTQKLNALPMYGYKFPKTYENVILQIINRKNAGIKLISYTEFVDTICRNANISKGGEDTLLNYLDKTGLVVYYPQNPKLKDFIYINPDWLTQQVYRLINNKLGKTEDKTEEKIEGKITLAYLEENLPDYKELGLLELFKQFDLIFEAKDETETFWIAPQYLPETLKNDKSFNKQINKSKLALVFRFSRFMPDNVMINFLSRYGSFAEDIYWKNGIYFTKNGIDCIVQKKNEKDLEVWIDKNQDGKTVLKEIVEAFTEFGKNAKTEISLDNQDFVSFQELKNDFEKGFREIKSLQGNRLEIEDFWFLFGKESSNPKPPTTMDYKTYISNALKQLERAEYASYFSQMDQVVFSNPKVTSRRRTTYSDLKNDFIGGFSGSRFAGQLEAYAKDLRNYLMEQEEVEVQLTQTLNTLPATTKEEIVAQVSEVKEVKGDTQSSKARQIFNKVMEKLATAGISIGSNWAMNFVLKSLGIDKEAIPTFMEIFKAFSDNKE